MLQIVGQAVPANFFAEIPGDAAWQAVPASIPPAALTPHPSSLRVPLGWQAGSCCLTALCRPVPIGSVGRVVPQAQTFSEPQTMKKQLSGFSILQSSKIATALYVLMGFVYTLIGIPMVLFGSDMVRTMGIFYILGPIFLGVLGFIFFVIFAALYNFLASVLGGFEFEVKTIE